MNKRFTKISFLTIGLMLLVGHIAIAQFDYNAILPPSPTAASLGQYGAIPVSYYTGTPNISIPIETIKGRELQVPISLSYMAKGIRVEENASWVGTGWSLNCGGVITQSIRGLEDGSRPRATFPVPTDFTQAKDYLTNIQEGFIDTEPDQYFFNYPGGSGSFVLDGNGNVIFEDANDVKVTADLPNHQFTITSEDGTKYIFNIAENTQYIGSSSTGGTSAVYLSKMVSPSGREVIDFIYSTAVTRFFSLSRPVRRVRPFNVKEDVYAPVFGVNIITCRPLTQIVTNFGTKVTFTPEDLPRQDLSIIGDPSGASRALKSIQFFDQFDNPGKKYVFTYETIQTDIPYTQYTGYDPPADQNTAYANYRLYLKSFGEVADDGSIVVPPYEFTYAGRTIDNKDRLPNKLSPAQDHWGYFNGQTSNLSLWPGYVGPYGYYDENFVDLKNCVITFGFFQSPQVSFPGANREPRFPENTYGTLSKVKYPTSGTTTYDFESQLYLFNAQSNSIVTRPVLKEAQAFVAGDATTQLDNIVTAEASNDVGHFSFEFSVECRDKDTKAPKQCATPNSEINLEKYQENSVSLFDSQGIEVIAAKWVLGDGGFRIYKGGVVDPTYQTLQPTSDGFITLDIVGLTFYNGNYTLKAHRDADGDKDVFGWFYYVHQETVPELTDDYARSAGGLRIKKIESFDDFGRSTGSKRYEYGPGVLVDPPLYTTYGYQSGLPMQFCPRSTDGGEANMFIHINSGPVSGLGVTKGSPVGYASVKEIQDGNGSIEYEYTTALEYPDFNFEAEPLKIAYFFWDYLDASNTGFQDYTVTKSFWPFPPVDAVDRKRGFLKKVSVRNQAGQLLKTTVSEPHITDENVVMGIRFQTLRPDQDWYWSTYKLSSGFVNVASQTETSYTHSPDTELTTTTNMYYEGNGHHMLTRKVTTNSDNSVLTAEMKYPNDYTTLTDPSHPIVRMKKQDLNVINSPIETRTSLDGTRIDGTLGVFTSNDKPGGGYFIAPKKVYKLKISSASAALTWESDPLLPDTVSKFDREALMYFDNLGNIRKVIPKDGVRKVYVWETGNSFPVAEVINAESEEVYCTSFETNTSATYSATGAKGGTRYWNSGSFNFTTNASFTPANPSNLKMSYWYWQGSSWTFSGEVPFSNSISSSGSRLDEIRVYPKGARVSTFTSQPLSGVTSTADVNSMFKFFEYDKLGRLRLIRDQDGNIVKRYTYHFGEE